MSPVVFIAIGAAVTVAMICVDFAHARYSGYMTEHRLNPTYDLVFWRKTFWTRNLTRAAVWSVLQWGAAGVAFAVTVKVSLWFMPFEAVGLFWGTIFGGSQRPRPGL